MAEYTDDDYERDGYTIAHCVAYTPPSDLEYPLKILMVKTVDGKIKYPSVIEGEPNIRFFVGVAYGEGLEYQHEVVANGVEIQQDSLKTFFEKVDY